MTLQPTLFDQPAVPGSRLLPLSRRLVEARPTRDLGDFSPLARNSDPVTSHDAAALAGLTAGSLRWRCLEVLAAGPLTDFELADQVERQQTSAGKRRGELVAAGLVVATDVKRPAPSGALAIVWAITDLGRDELR